MAEARTSVSGVKPMRASEPKSPGWHLTRIGTPNCCWTGHPSIDLLTGCWPDNQNQRHRCFSPRAHAEKQESELPRLLQIEAAHLFPEGGVF
jgi:hypothetical protein